MAIIKAQLVFMLFLVFACGQQQSQVEDEVPGYLLATGAPDVIDSTKLLAQITDVGRVRDVLIDGTTVYTASDTHVSSTDFSGRLTDAKATLTTNKFETFVKGLTFQKRIEKDMAMGRGLSKVSMY